METPKDGSNGAADKNAAENPCRDPENQERSGSTDAADEVDVVPDSQPSRRPFTSLSQEDSDLILARALQEQERAYMMLRMGGGEYESSHSGSYVNEEEDEDEDDDDHLHEDVDDAAGADVNEIEGETMNEEISEGVVENVEAEGEEDIVGDRDEDDEDDGVGDEDEEEDEDVFDVHERELEEEIDPANFDSDEAYARALQEAEERGLAARMMAIASINEWEDEGDEEDRSYSQDTWQEVDPDELSYEELLALSEVVGTESRGLSADVVASLPSSVYNPKNSLNGTSDQCVICRVDYDEGERVIILSCKHTYHAECINNWLQINKVCPVCNVEVSASNQG